MPTLNEVIRHLTQMRDIHGGEMEVVNEDDEVFYVGEVVLDDTCSDPIMVITFTERG